MRESDQRSTHSHPSCSTETLALMLTRLTQITTDLTEFLATEFGNYVSQSHSKLRALCPKLTDKNGQLDEQSSSSSSAMLTPSQSTGQGTNFTSSMLSDLRAAPNFDCPVCGNVISPWMELSRLFAKRANPAGGGFVIDVNQRPSQRLREFNTSMGTFQPSEIPVHNSAERVGNSGIGGVPADQRVHDPSPEKRRKKFRSIE